MVVYVCHAVFISCFAVEELRVEEGQLLAGQGTGGEQSVRPVTELIGADMESAVFLRLHRDFGPDFFIGTGSIHQLEIFSPVVKGHGISILLPGVKLDGAGGVGIPVEVVIGVVLRQIGKAAHADGAGLRHGQAGPPGQDRIRLFRGDSGEIHLRVIAVVKGVRHRLPLRRRNGLL